MATKYNTQKVRIDFNRLIKQYLIFDISNSIISQPVEFS